MSQFSEVPPCSLDPGKSLLMPEVQLRELPCVVSLSAALLGHHCATAEALPFPCPPPDAQLLSTPEPTFTSLKSEHLYMKKTHKVREVTKGEKFTHKTDKMLI